MTAELIDKKQLLFHQTDSETGDKIDQNVFLLAAVNMYRCGPKASFKVDLDHKNLKTLSAKPLIPNGIVFMGADEVNALDDHTLEVMQSSQAILTHDVKLNDLFCSMVEKATDEEEKKWKWALNCLVFVISKKDWLYLQTPKVVEKPDFMKDKSLSKV
jgi:hypothetical protein